MLETTFVGRRQERWTTLETLVSRIDGRGPRALPPEDLRDLALLYRAATADLATAQSRAYSGDLVAYLNRLVARAYAAVYASHAEGGWARIVTFFTTTFPREVRASVATIAAVVALFVAATIVSYAVVRARPLDAYALLPASAIPTVTRSLHDSNFGFDRAYAPEMSGLIITNNIRVTMIAFAGGMTLGVLTLESIAFNGVVLGAVGALFARKGFGLDFVATVAPHGVIELTAIQIAGAAGLLLARAIVAPGRERRVDALKTAARRGGVLMLGVASMLLVAGTIEGFVSPQRLSIPLRIGIGALTAAALAGYFGFAGRARGGAMKTG